jgi:two-component sensor histidine kinase
MALILHELATNAVVHAQTEFTVRLEERPDSLRLTVQDGSQIAPAPAQALHTALGISPVCRELRLPAFARRSGTRWSRHIGRS